jgi:hypothetical protein
MEKEPREQTQLEMLQEAIAESRGAIEAEFERTANDWLSCFGSRVFQVEAYLGLRKVKASFSPENYQKALVRMETLKERLHELKDQYPDKATVPPDEIKEELLADLNVVRDLTS